MRLTSKNHCVLLHENKQERKEKTKGKGKQEKRKMIRQRRRRKYGRNEREEGRIWKVKLNFDEGTWCATMNCTPRCSQMVAVVRGYWFFSAVFRPYRAISNRERRAQNRHVFFSPFRLYDSSYLFLSFGFSFHVSNRSFVCLRNITLIVLLLRYSNSARFLENSDVDGRKELLRSQFFNERNNCIEYGTSYL